MDRGEIRLLLLETEQVLVFEQQRIRGALGTAEGAVLEAQRVVEQRRAQLAEVSARLAAQREALVAFAEPEAFVPTYNDAAPVTPSQPVEAPVVVLTWRDGRSDERLTLVSESQDGVTVSVRDEHGRVASVMRDELIVHRGPDLSGLARREAVS